MYQRSVRKRPVKAVAREYGSFGGKLIILWDDNIAGDLEYAKALFRAIAAFTASGGAVRQASMPRRMMSFSIWRRAADASSCFSGSNQSARTAWTESRKGSIVLTGMQRL